MGITISEMRVEYEDQPIGLQIGRPRFGWTMQSAERSQLQTAFQVLVSGDVKLVSREIGEMWDSGKVYSGQSAHVEYDGKPLQSDTTYYWRVRVWDKFGQPSDWSPARHWSMGLMNAEEWMGQWIGSKKASDESCDEPNDAPYEIDTAIRPSPYVRKTFEVDGTVKRACLYAAALGLYELHLNGARLGQDFFHPGWTDYTRKVQYQTYDVTRLLTSGTNAVGAVIGTGWYSGYVGMYWKSIYGEQPAFSMQLHVEYEDGRRTVVVSDRTWKAAFGPIRASDMLMGEIYDARKEMPGWATPGFEDDRWQAVDLFPAYGGSLVAGYEPPVRVTQDLTPVSLTETNDGTYIFDIGQNIAGWARLQVSGPAGTEVCLRYGEMLNPDGSLYTDNLRKARQTDVYILKGIGTEEYEPHFTFHGFRYVELSGYPGKPDLSVLLARAVHSDTRPTGNMETSNRLVNQLYSNIYWGQRGNFLSVPTDCPQRDERLGWTGDAQIFSRTACYNMDVARFFIKYMDDIREAQFPSGAFPDVAPEPGLVKRRIGLGKHIEDGTAGWGDAGVIIPWTVYLMYGDLRFLETNYPAMLRWIDYLCSHSSGYIRPAHGYGDWLAHNADTPKEVVATAYFAYSVKLVSQIAYVLGKKEDTQRYSDLFRQIKDAFCSRFVNEDGEIYGNTQSGYVLALHFELLPAQLRPKALQHLLVDLERRGWHLSTGFLGVGYLLPVLSENGEAATALRLLLNETFPSWGYSIKHGATTIWERWDGWTAEHGFQDPGMNSFNHYSLGSVGEWLYRYLGGIEADPAYPGFKRIRIKPFLQQTIDKVNTTFRSVHGAIACSWKFEIDAVHVLLEIPVNTTAVIELSLPSVSIKDISENGITLKKHPDLQLNIWDERGAVLEAGSGTYRLVITYE